MTLSGGWQPSSGEESLLKLQWEPWLGLTVHPPDYVLSFAEVMNRRKDKPLPLQPSDLSGTTFDSFSLKRVLKKSEKH